MPKSLHAAASLDSRTTFISTPSPLGVSSAAGSDVSQGLSHARRSQKTTMKRKSGLTRPSPNIDSLVFGGEIIDATEPVGEVQDMDYSQEFWHSRSHGGVGIDCGIEVNSNSKDGVAQSKPMSFRPRTRPYKR